MDIIILSSVKEEKQEDLLADLQDISDSERKTSTAESSVGKHMHAHAQDIETYYQMLLHFARVWNELPSALCN